MNLQPIERQSIHSELSNLTPRPHKLLQPTILNLGIHPQVGASRKWSALGHRICPSASASDIGFKARKIYDGLLLPGFEEVS